MNACFYYIQSSKGFCKRLNQLVVFIGKGEGNKVFRYHCEHMGDIYFDEPCTNEDWSFCPRHYKAKT